MEEDDTAPLAVKRFRFDYGGDDLFHGSQAGEYDPNNNSDDLEHGEMGQDPNNNSDYLEDGEMGQEDSEKTVTEKDYAQEGATTVEMSTTPAPPDSNHDDVHAPVPIDMRHQHDSTPATHGCTNGPSETRNNLKTERGDKHRVNGKRDDVRAESEPIMFKSASSGSNCSFKILKRRVPVKINSIEDVMKQYLGMGSLLGYDMEGSKEKVQEILRVSFLGLQETSMVQVDLFGIRAMWGNNRFDVASSSARGQSGGILSVWDPTIFTRKRIVCTTNVVIVEGLWVVSNFPCYMVNVYAPQDIPGKQEVWRFLHNFVIRHRGNYCFFGDFNVVRDETERHGSLFCRTTASAFNDFIDGLDLVDVPMTGKRFTRIDAAGAKMNKLDRFLVTEEFVDVFGQVEVAVLDWKCSDHCPIFLHSSLFDYGRSPFKFFNSWLKIEGFEEVVERFQAWNVRMKADWDGKRQQCETRLMVIDVLFDQGNAPLELVAERRGLLRDIVDMDKIQSMDNVQKSKIKCIGVAAALQLEATFSEEEVKRDVWDCGSDKASGPDGFAFKFLKQYWELLGQDVVNFFQEFHSRAYIPLGCNSSFITLIPKVDNPLFLKDYRPIILIGVQFKVIAKLLANKIASILHGVIGGEQSAFLKGRQILDGPLIMSELVSCFKKRKKKLLIFKVDFEKAYDSVLVFLGFGNTWRRWVQALFRNARSSVLVNSSPTDEFQLFRGLRQGNPLSPFLFIIVMEGLHVAMEDVVSHQMFLGVPLDMGGSTLSHLFYADDVLFMGEWEERNIQNLIFILRCFFMASGLKINLLKSNLFGIAASEAEVCALASFTGCSAESMARVKGWKVMIDRFQRRLSTWKIKLLSFGGRLTLLNMVRVLGDGVHTRFWREIWCGDTSVSESLPRLFALALDPDARVRDMHDGESGKFLGDRLVARWLQLDVPDFISAANMVDWVDSRPVARMERSIVDVVCSTVIWVLWTYRNAVVFKKTNFKKNYGGITDPSLAKSKMDPICRSKEDWEHMCTYWETDKAKENILKMNEEERGNLVLAGKSITPEMEYEIEKNMHDVNNANRDDYDDGDCVEIDDVGAGQCKKTGKRKREKKQTSPVWNVFELLKTKDANGVEVDVVINGKRRAKCKWCGEIKNYDSATGNSNLMRHISKCYRENTPDIGQILLGKDKDSLKLKSSKLNPDIFREELVRAIVMHNLPLSFVDKEGPSSVKSSTSFVDTN
ncbi:hypothetical protein LXL04_019961 [Taraxacum kok-saghyz]